MQLGGMTLTKLGQCEHIVDKILHMCRTAGTRREREAKLMSFKVLVHSHLAGHSQPDDFSILLDLFGKLHDLLVALPYDLRKVVCANVNGHHDCRERVPQLLGKNKSETGRRTPDRRRED